MNTIKRHPVLLLFALAMTVRLVAYAIFNVYLFGWEFQHPDSVLYNYQGEYYDNTIWARLRYSTLIGNLYDVYESRVLPEMLNVLLGAVTVVIGYHTVPKRAAVWVGLFLALDPYLVYLSTQLLKETFVIFSVALIFWALPGRRPIMIPLAFVALMLLGLLRYQFIILASVVLVTNYILVFRTRLRPSFRVCILAVAAAFFLIPTAYFVSPTQPLFLIRSAQGALEGDPEKEKLPDEVLTRITEGFYTAPYLGDNVDPVTGRPLVFRGEVQPPVQHIEFFRYRAAKSTHNMIRLNVTPSEYVWGFIDGFFFPFPWEADTSFEGGFALYMLYWYVIMLLLALGLTRGRLFLSQVGFYLLFGFAVVMILTLPTSGTSALMRWRLMGFYPLILAAGIAMTMLPSPKRVFDVGFSLFALIPFLPVWILTGLILKVTRGRIFFTQSRIGKDGKEFTIFKFISMGQGSDGKVAEDEDERVTWFGRFLRSTALDEIPEFVNVLRGEMSVVGPRPYATWEDKEVSLEHWKERTSVLPGLIGLAQIHSHRADHETKLRWDLEYVDKRGFWFDLWLVIRGLKSNLKREWV